MKKIICKLIIILSIFVLPSLIKAETTLLTKVPKIRVGLYSTDDWVEVTADYSFKIKQGTKNIIAELQAGEKVLLKYDKANSQYLVKIGEEEYTSSEYIRIVPKKANQVITITNYENRPDWDPDINDNEFKGKLEIRYAEATDTTWVINILGLENYVKGVSEAGNDNDADYLKALYTAARTYAYWHYLNPYKHDDENYLLGTTASDQVYRGYNFTERAPNIAQAVSDTRGQIAYYEVDVAVTPYFSQSDGRTRSWSEVWAGDYPYLISVDDPGCEGDELLGHGVGMSAKGARYFAETEGWGWKKILKYYYTGVNLQKIYY